MNGRVVIDGQSLCARDVVAVMHGAHVDFAPDARARVSANAAAAARLAPSGMLERKRRVLVGGFAADAQQTEGVYSARNFVVGHCAGVGEPLDSRYVRGLMVCRANVLALGHSGVRPEAVELLLNMLNTGVHPVVPSQGSVGAAGDLAPLAHVARVACRYGGKAWRDGEIVEADVAMDGIPVFVPEEKEALALINGATLTSAMAAAAVHRAQRVLLAAEVACAMSMEAGLADLRCLDLYGLQARGHRGAVEVAAQLQALLKGSVLSTTERAPDSFSTRCAPAVLGAAAEAIEHVAKIVDRELNGACDNPLVMDDREIELGNFHGAPIALAMDYLKIALTQVAGISERRVFRLTYGHLARGLPSFLIEETGVNSGFMLAQYTAASLVSACKGLAHPGSVDSIPTIQHHEDHVSMGPISARTCLKLLENVADVVAIEALVAAQALDFRQAGVRFEPSGERVQGDPVALAPGVAEAHAVMRISLPHWESDRVLHPELRAAGRIVRSGALGSVAGAGLLDSPW